MQELLEMISRPTPSQFFDRMNAPAHASACDTSCPDCLRSYSNLAYHSLLDWRLAIDMAALALDPAALITLASPAWTRLSALAATTLLSARTGFRRNDNWRAWRPLRMAPALKLSRTRSGVPSRQI